MPLVSEPLFTNSPINYTTEGLSRLRQLILEQRGIRNAAIRANVQEATLRKILLDRPITKYARSKVEEIVGPLVADPKPKDDNFPNSSKLLRLLTTFVDQSCGIVRAADRLGVRPSTVQKILKGERSSTQAAKMILARLKTENFVPEEIRHERHTRLKEIHRLYKELGTLEAVGKKLGLTRERVRQLLVKGTDSGLFEYKPYEYPYIERAKLVDDYLTTRSLLAVAKQNAISPAYLSKLLTAYRITPLELDRLRQTSQKNKCIADYAHFRVKFGYDPTTTELQQTGKGRYLHNRIIRLWGSIDSFRDEHNIPKPPRGSASFNEDMEPWRQHRRRLALIRRMQQLDTIRDFLTGRGPVKLSEITAACGFAPQRAFMLIKLLLATHEIRRLGTAFQTKYVLYIN